MDEHSCEGNGTRSIHQGMGVLEKVGNVIIKLMEGWKTRLEIIQDGKILTSRMINISQDSQFSSNILSNGRTCFNVDQGDWWIHNGMKSRKKNKKNTQSIYWPKNLSRESLKTWSFEWNDRESLHGYWSVLQSNRTCRNCF